MKKWHPIPSNTRLEADTLVNSARTLGIPSMVVKSEGKYFSLVNCTLEQKDELISSYIAPDIPKDYEESDANDLNLMLSEAKSLKTKGQKALVGRLLAMELKRLTEKNKIIVASTDDRKNYIRRVGHLSGDNFEDMILQVTGDHKGMAVWNNLPLSSIEELKV